MSRNSIQIDQEQLNDILLSRRKYPWTKEEFIAYLKTEYSEESFEFMLEFERLRTISSKEQLLKESTHVFDLYVKEGSEKQINVSSAVRSSAENAFKKDPCEIESIYRGIYYEARSLLLTGLHIKKFNDFVLKNLDNTLAYNRIIHCIIFFVLALGVSLCLIFLLPNDRWIRFASLPLWHIFAMLFVFRTQQMCPISTFFRVRCSIKGETTGGLGQAWKYIKIEDETIIRRISKMSKLLHLCSIFIAAGFMATIVSVPLVQ